MEQQLETVTCPHCGKTLQVPPQTRGLVCMYCAAALDTAPNEPADADVLLDEAIAAFAHTAFTQGLPLKSFNAQDYPAHYHAFTAGLEPALCAYSRAARLDAAAAKRMSEWMLEQYAAALRQAGVTRENDPRMFEHRYALVSLLVPALAAHSAEGDALAAAFLAGWNTAHPKNPLTKCTFAEINAGFHKRACYITTAVCGSLEMADDCDALCAFRAFRDGWLAVCNRGAGRIREYYLFAPAILRAIAQTSCAAQVYREIWNRHLRLCLRDLQTCRPRACARRYTRMVRTLEREFLA